MKDKTVVITGASSGIGEAMARLYAKMGAKVVLAARNEERLALLAQLIRSEGGEAVYVAADVTKEWECKRIIEKAVEEYDGIDVLICNAGISMRANFDEVDTAVLHRVMDVNFWGTVYCAKYALPYLVAAKGSLVGISSVAGLHGLPGRTGYSASKFAMTGLLETIRIENLKRGLHVMIACPGYTATNVRYSALLADGTPQGASPRNENKMMSAEEVARRVAEGIAKRKRLCLMDIEGRATHFVKKFAPSLLDRVFRWVVGTENGTDAAEREQRAN
ncbi:MAG: SDR family oxidoreductase [Alistipes sp.]|nr:SDR family oxidoreductase [Alistipes sp.]